MTEAIRTHVSDGTTSLYAVDFELGYLERTHVFVYPTLEPTNYLVYTWISDTQIQLATSSIPANGIEFKIERRTPSASLINDFADGAILREEELDRSFKQAIMLNRETLDDIEENTISEEEVLELISEADLGAGGGSIISDTPPAAALQGTRWTNCTNQRSYVFTGTEWVEDRPSIGTTKNPLTYSTVATMLAAQNISAGDRVSTIVNNTTSNAGGAEYLVKLNAQAATEGDVIDGFENHQLQNGLVAILVHGVIIDPRKIGVVYDGSDTDAAVNQCIVLQRRLQIPIQWTSGTLGISTTKDLRGINSIFQGAGTSLTIFAMATDNIPIFQIGQNSAGSANSHGAIFSGFRAVYTTPQGDTRTAANAFELYYVRHSVLHSLEAHDCYRGFYAPSTPTDNHFFSNTVYNLKVRNASKNYYAISSGTAAGNTGNDIRNLYASGNRADVASATCDIVYLFERMSDSDIGQMNAEWIKCDRAIVWNRCMPRVSGIHLEGLSARASNSSFISLIGSIIDMTVRVKTCNLSGGDPETQTVGGIANFALYQIEDESTTGVGSQITLRGSNTGCVAANANNRFAFSNSGWDREQYIDVVSWKDTDSIFTTTSGTPIVNFAAAPSTPHMPILRAYNNINYRPFVRAGSNSGSPAGTVLWTQVEDANNCYDESIGEFKAPEQGTFTYDFSLETAGDVELRFRAANGNEQTAKRVYYGGSGTHVNGSLSFRLQKDESVYVHSFSPAAISSISKMSIVML